MIGYTMVGTNNLTDAVRFYDAVLAPLGLTPVEVTDDYVGYAPESAPKVSDVNACGSK
jgi:hypothetical protein